MKDKGLHKDKLGPATPVSNGSPPKGARQQKRHLLEIINASTDYIGIAAMDGQAQYYNPAFSDLLEGIGLGSESHATVDLHPDWANHKILEEGIPTALAEGVWRGETAVKGIDGDEIPVDQIILAHRNGSGDITHLSTVMRDISVTKRREEAMLRTIEELDQFAHVAAHDLRSPLNAIEMLAHALLEDAGDSLDSTNREHLRLIFDRIERMDGLLKGLLKYARIHHMNREPLHVDVKALVDTAWGLHARPGFTFEVDLEVRTIHAAQVPMERVLANLLDNSLKHHDKDTGHIVVRTTRAKNGGMTLSVEDDGPGIAPKHRERVQKIFQTLRSKDELNASGMGLALVKRTVLQNGGELRLESNTPRGLRAIIDWPEASG